MFGPILRGKKVVLRPVTTEDLPNYVKWFADMEVTRYLGRAMAVSQQEEEEWFKRVAEAKNDVVWALEVEGKHVGASGIHSIDWLNGHALTGTVIGDKEHWRRGVGTESVALRTRYAFRELNLHKLKTYVFVDNEAMKRALLKSGYREVGVQREEMWRDGRWHDMWSAEVLRADWEREHGSDTPS